MATYIIEALNAGGSVVDTTTVTATGPTSLGTVGELFPSLPIGQYTFRALTPETGAYTVDSFAFAMLYANDEGGLIYDPSQSVLTSGDPLTGATDRINTNDAAQATAANQPTYDLTAGVHSFQTDGVDDWLRIPNFPIGSDFTAIFSLTDPLQDQAGASVLRPLFSAADVSGYGPGSNYYGIAFLKDGGLRFSINGENVDVAYTPDGSATVLTFRKEGTLAQIFRDGVEIASGTLSTTSGFATGDYAFFANASDLNTGRAAKTDLYHVMIIDRALTAQEQADAEALSATFAGPVVTNAPTYSFAGFADGTFYANVEDTEDSSVDLYFTIDQEALVDEPNIAQLVAGQDQTGAAADFSQGPTTVSTGIVDLDLDISGLAEGNYVFRSVAKDSGDNYSPILNEEITVDIPFTFSFTRADGLLSAEAGWSQGDDPADDGELRIVSNELVFDPESANGRCRVVTDAVKPENQYIEFTPSALTEGSFNQFIQFRIRTGADGLGGHLLDFDPTETATGEITISGLSGGAVTTSGKPKIGSEYRFQHIDGVVSLLEDGAVILSGTDSTVTGGGQSSIRFFFAEAVSSFAINGEYKFGAL